MTFFPRGDKLIGLLQLKAASNNARYAATEAEVVRLQVYYQFEENYTKALEIARGLHERFPDNPYFHRYVGKNLIIKNRLDSAEKIWREVLIGYMDKKTAYDVFAAREALYYVGYCLMNRSEYDMAVKYFKKCIEASEKIDDGEPSGFMVQSNLRLAKLYDLLNKRDLAKKHYEKVLDMPDKQNSHDAAERYLESPYGR